MAEVCRTPSGFTGLRCLLDALAVFLSPLKKCYRQKRADLRPSMAVSSRFGCKTFLSYKNTAPAPPDARGICRPISPQKIRSPFQERDHFTILECCGDHLTVLPSSASVSMARSRIFSSVCSLRICSALQASSAAVFFVHAQLHKEVGQQTVTAIDALAISPGASRVRLPSPSTAI